MHYFPFLLNDYSPHHYQKRFRRVIFHLAKKYLQNYLFANASHRNSPKMRLQSLCPYRTDCESILPKKTNEDRVNSKFALKENATDNHRIIGTNHRFSSPVKYRRVHLCFSAVVTAVSTTMTATTDKKGSHQS